MDYGLAVYKNDGNTSELYVSRDYASENYVVFDSDVDGAGQLIFSSASIVWMYVDTIVFNAGDNATITRTYPEYEGWTLVSQVMLPQQPPDAQEHYAPRVTVTGNQVVVDRQPNPINPSVPLAAYNAYIYVLARNTSEELIQGVFPPDQESTGGVPQAVLARLRSDWTTAGAAVFNEANGTEGWSIENVDVYDTWEFLEEALNNLGGVTAVRESLQFSQQQGPGTYLNLFRMSVNITVNADTRLTFRGNGQVASLVNETGTLYVTWAGVGSPGDSVSGGALVLTNGSGTIIAPRLANSADTQWNLSGSAPSLDASGVTIIPSVVVSGGGGGGGGDDPYYQEN